MKYLPKKIFTRNTWLLLASISLFGIAYLLNKYVFTSTSERYYTRQIQQRIQDYEKDFQRMTADTSLIGSLVDGTYNESTLENLQDKAKGYGFFIYDKTYSDPELIFWNTQIALPDAGLPDENNVSRMIRLQNGFYIHTRKMLSFRNGRKLVAEGLIPVMWKYIVENDNLRKEFVDVKKAIQQVDISTQPTDFQVQSTYGNVLFYLQKNRTGVQPGNSWSIGLIIAGFLLLFLCIQQVAHFIYKRYGFWFGVSFLVIAILVLRLTIYVFPGLLKLRQFELFDPTIYGSSYVLSSLGDLLINVLLLCWIIIFINRRVKVAAIVPYTAAWKNWVLVLIALTIQVVFTFIIVGILQSLVADAKISFNVTNFFSLIATPYSFIGFLVLAIMALSYFFLSQVLLTLAGKLIGGRNYFTFILTAFIALAILSFIDNTAMVELDLYVLPWLLIFVWLLQQKIFSGLNFKLNVSEVLFWLFVFSFSMSAVIIFENRKIDLETRRRIADRIAQQADPASERLLSVTLTYLDSNFLQQNFRRFSDRKTNAFIKDSIINRSLQVYLNKYDTKIYTFDTARRPLFNDDPASYDTLNTIFQVQGQRTNIAGLRYFGRSFDKINYIFRKEATDSGRVKLGTLFVLSDPKSYKSDALTPELFKQTRELVPVGYSYAVYDSSRNLIANYNDYPFSTYLLDSQIPGDEVTVKRNNSYEELWYRPTPDKVVIIARKSDSFIEAITLFAYLFSTFLFLLAFYRFATFLVRSRLRVNALKQYWQLSIRSQIHSTIIMVSLLSFIVIGVATILFFINRYERNNQDKLTKAIQMMVGQVQANLEKQSSFDEGYNFYDQYILDQTEKVIKQLAEVYAMDVNIYDTSGNLKITSNTDMNIYTTGVLSTKMNPVAYFRLKHLNQVQTVTEENVGRVNYLSIYSPIRNKSGSAVAYLNIPTFSNQRELKQEISNFLVTVINLNAFIFLIAGAIALLITNRITSSFTLITEKMKDINLRKMNEEITWKRDDEIGVLVKEYNKMVQKLDQSAEALAKSEREGAWRQMARQVAHEIKNPLTPMKLSIQYLQKAIDNNSPDVKKMTTNVAKTLIEQIDHLSKIASDFSQFANIGNPKNEVFDLHDMLSSLSSLYDATENLDYKWKPVKQRVLLFADKTQLNRLFTNLLQNAVEASENRSKCIIRLNEELNGEYITISVQDNGEGIPEQTQSRIFTPNFTTKSSGTGLGLAMSKSIVEQANGEIWFITTVGVGTTFYVKLPYLRATN